MRKALGLGAVVAAAAGTEACSPAGENGTQIPSKETSSAVNVESPGGRLKEQYKILKEKRLNHSKIILNNLNEVLSAQTLEALDLSKNSLLKYYYLGLNGEHDIDIFDAGREMRVLEIAKNKGIEIDLSHGLKMEIKGGLVPHSAKVNGIDIPIDSSDYTSRELELVQFANSNSKNLQTENPSPQTQNRVRTSPEF